MCKILRSFGLEKDFSEGRTYKVVKKCVTTLISYYRKRDVPFIRLSSIEKGKCLVVMMAQHLQVQFRSSSECGGRDLHVQIK